MLAYLAIGDIVLHDEIGLSDDPVPRAVKACPGLVGIPGIRATREDRPDDHGSIPPARTVLPARSVPLEVELWGGSLAPSLAAAWVDFRALVQYLTANINRDMPVTRQLAGDTLLLSGSARLAGAVLPPFETTDQVLTCQIPLIFDDPAWYSSTIHAESIGAPTASGGMPLPLVFPMAFGEGAIGGTLAITNNGDADAYPVITVNGPASAPRISDVTSGQTLDFAGLVLGVGDTLEVRCKPSERSATVAGLNARGALATGSRFFVIPGGETHVISWQAVAGGTTAGSTLTVTLRDTYLT
jgi:hypothetical protein